MTGQYRYGAEGRIAAHLRQFVECLWVNSIEDADPAEDLRILPDGRIDLVWIPLPSRCGAGAAAGPGGELLDQHVPLDAVRPALAARLTPGSEGRAIRLTVLERELLRSLDGLGELAERVGYGPKTFQRVARFQRAVGELRRAGAELARAAASAGYADQAHLTRESRRLAGLSPRELVSWIG
jgi:AraC-like DNA-binding protein